MTTSVKQRELSRRGSRLGSFLFFYGKTRPNSQQKTPRVTPLGVFCFPKCFRLFSTARVPRSDSLFAEPGSGVRSQPAGSAPTPPKSPLQLLGSLLNTPLRVNNPVSSGEGLWGICNIDHSGDLFALPCCIAVRIQGEFILKPMSLRIRPARTIISFNEYQHAAFSLRGIGEAGPNVVSGEIRQVLE